MTFLCCSSYMSTGACGGSLSICAVTGIRAARAHQATAVLLLVCAAAWTACAGTPASALQMAHCGSLAIHLLMKGAIKHLKHSCCCVVAGTQPLVTLL